MLGQGPKSKARLAASTARLRFFETAVGDVSDKLLGGRIDDGQHGAAAPPIHSPSMNI